MKNTAIANPEDDKISKIIAQRVTHSPTGLEFSTATSYEEWSAALPFYLNLRDKSKFWLGDAIIFGSTNFADRYSQAIEITGRTKHDLINIVSVCERIEKSRRRELSFEHHAAVAYLPYQEADRLLKEAEAKDLNRYDLRDAVAKLQGKPTAAEKTAAKEAKKNGGAKPIEPKPEPPTIDVQTTITKGGDENCPHNANANVIDSSSESRTHVAHSTDTSGAAQPSNPADAASPPKQDDRADQPEYFLSCFVASIPRINVKSLSVLQAKTWLHKLKPVDDWIDVLSKKALTH